MTDTTLWPKHGQGMQWPPDRPKPFSREPAVADWTTDDLRHLLGYRDLRVELSATGWRATVRSFRRVVYRVDAVTLPQVLDALVAWAREGCEPMKRETCRCDCCEG